MVTLSNAQNTQTQLITAWEWIDPEENLSYDEDTAVWVLGLPGASESNPAMREDVVSLLPESITATLDEGEETISLDGWTCEGYPEAGAESGSYTFTAVLPAGYELDEDVSPLSVEVVISEAAAVQYSEGTVALLLDDSGGYKEYSSLADAIYGVPKTGIETTIKIVNNIDLTRTVWISENRNIVLTSDSEYMIECSGSSTSSYLDVFSGASLTIDGNLTIIANATDTNARPLVSLYGAEFKLKAGTLSVGNAEFYRSIVTMDKSSTFTMSGGTICGNPEKQSIGVYIQDWLVNAGTETVTFNMAGGTIKDCHSSSDGGAIYVMNDKAVEVNLTSGSIENCSANRGGAICMGVGTLTIGSDPLSVSDCSADDMGGAVYLKSGANFTMNGGTISKCGAGNQGGAIAVNQNTSFIMNGGLIEECYATSSHGDGVYVNVASFTMNGGTISKCQTTSANNGGGIYLNDSTFTMSKGTITDCTSGNRGGAVFLLGTSKMTMDDGTISKNIASS